MKKYALSFILSFAFLFMCTPYSVKASDENIIVKSTATKYYEDGSYSTITIVEYDTRATSTKSGAVIYDYVGKNGDKQWSYTVHGTFTYNGSSSTCTAVSDSYSIYNSDWYIDSHSCWRSGNTAYGTITMKYKVLGITVLTIPKDASLSCSANGTLS